RQELTATPYALSAVSAPWAGLTGIPDGFADGVDNTDSLWSPNGADIFFTGGNVGIGTATPAATLDVIGSLKLDSFLMPTGAAAGKVLTSDDSGNGAWLDVPGGSGLTLPYSGSGNVP